MKCNLINDARLCLNFEVLIDSFLFHKLYHLINYSLYIHLCQFLQSYSSSPSSSSSLAFASAASLSNLIFSSSANVGSI